MKFWIHGISGRMGQELVALLKSDFPGSILVGGSHQESMDLSPIDSETCIIDFSSAEGSTALAKNLMRAPKAILVASTGLKNDGIWEEFARKNSQTRILVAPNTSFGIFLTFQLLGFLKKSVAAKDYDWRIEETHHRMKKDSPSGTALFLQKNTPEAPIQSVRAGGVFGEHSIRLVGLDEEITISHRAFSRKLFARGAIRLTELLLKKPAGFYNLETVDI